MKINIFTNKMQHIYWINLNKSILRNYTKKRTNIFPKKKWTLLLIKVFRHLCQKIPKKSIYNMIMLVLEKFLMNNILTNIKYNNNRFVQILFTRKIIQDKISKLHLSNNHQNKKKLRFQKHIIKTFNKS